MNNGEGHQTYYNKGFTLVELLAIIVISSILMSIAVISVIGITKQTEKEVCEANQSELERNYRMQLIIENKVLTITAFNEFLLSYGDEICTVGGEISFLNGKVECSIHSESDADSGDDEEDEVPYL